jgi:hypothetical protein
MARLFIDGDDRPIRQVMFRGRALYARIDENSKRVLWGLSPHSIWLTKADVILSRGHSRLRLEPIASVGLRRLLQEWALQFDGVTYVCWPGYPAAAQLRDAVAEVRKIQRAARPDPNAPNYLGWCSWDWNGEFLEDPWTGRQWHGLELVEYQWQLGQTGIRAKRIPRDWRHAEPHPDLVSQKVSLPYGRRVPRVSGIVERFGYYVVEKEGWRAERALIRQLLAPTAGVQMLLKRAYPEVQIFCRDDEPTPAVRQRD